MKRFSYLAFTLALSMFTFGFAFAASFKVDLTHQALDTEVMVAGHLPDESLIVIQPGTWVELTPMADQRPHLIEQGVLIQPVELPDVVMATVSEISAGVDSSTERSYTHTLNSE